MTPVDPSDPIDPVDPTAPEAAEADADVPKSFLQDLKELKVLVTDKDLLDLHKR